MTQTWQGKQHTLYCLYFNIKKCGNAHYDHLIIFSTKKNHLGITNLLGERILKLGFVFNCVNDSGQNLRIIVVLSKEVMAMVWPAVSP